MTSSSPRPADPGEWAVLCEGFHDRSFVAGLFENHFGLRQERTDDRGAEIARGHFGYRNRAGAVVRVVPCGSKSRLVPETRKYLARLATDPLRGLVLVTDEDTACSAADARERALARLRTQAEQFGGAIAGDEILVNQGTPLLAITWGCDDLAPGAVPPAQCLERLVVASLVASFPERGEIVKHYLSDTKRVGYQDGADAINKAYSWSHMAGWYAGEGCDGFLRCLWNDSRVVPQLRSRLDETGAWGVFERIVST